MSIKTVYTRTHDQEGARFSEGTVWGALDHPTRMSRYGAYIWELEVDLSPSEEGRFYLSNEVIPDGWVWGQKEEKGETWVGFNATQIVSSTLVRVGKELCEVAGTLRAYPSLTPLPLKDLSYFTQYTVLGKYRGSTYLQATNLKELGHYLRLIGWCY